MIVFENPNQEALPDRGAIGGFLHWLGEGIGFAQPENEDFIKRVIALPGETIEIRDKVVYIDGEPLDEPYLTRAAKSAMSDFPLKEVPQGELFVMGDNRGNSADSRYGLGTVPVDKVIGKAFVVIWPPSHLGGGSSARLLAPFLHPPLVEQPVRLSLVDRAPFEPDLHQVLERATDDRPGRDAEVFHHLPIQRRPHRVELLLREPRDPLLEIVLERLELLRLEPVLRRAVGPRAGSAGRGAARRT